MKALGMCVVFTSNLAKNQGKVPDFLHWIVGGVFIHE